MPLDHFQWLLGLISYKKFAGYDSYFLFEFFFMVNNIVSMIDVAEARGIDVYNYLRYSVWAGNFVQYLW